MVICGRCGFIYMYRRSVGKELDKIYGNEWYFTGRYEAGNEKVTTDYLRDKPNIMVFVRRRYATISKYKKRGRILDVGAAMGFYLEHFKKRGWDVYGIEISPFAAEYAQNKLGIKNMFVGDVDHASYPKGFFDVITLWLMIEHLVEPAKTLARVRRWLKTGGIIGIKTPTAGGLTGRLDPVQWFRQHPDDHTVDFTIETLAEMLEKSGYEVLEWETEGIYLDRAYRALRMPMPRDRKTLRALDSFYQKFAKAMQLGDSLVMFARKKR